MAQTWDKLDKTTAPELAIIDAYVNNPLWAALRGYLETEYASKPVIEYSGCGMRPGWNVKYKKAGRGLCTLYPEDGGFVALVVIGEREKAETELALPTLTPYTQQLYATTKEGMGQRWLMFQVSGAAVLEDVKRCIAIRHGAKKAG